MITLGRTKIYLWDYVTPWGRKKIQAIRFDKAVRLLFDAIEPFIGRGAVLLGQELRLLEKRERVDYYTQVWLGITAIRRKNWRVEIIFDKRKSHFVVGDLVRTGPHASSPMHRETWYRLENEVIVVCLTTDGKLKFVRGGRERSYPNDFDDNWKQEFLASADFTTDLTEQARLILEAVRLLSFVGSNKSLKEVFGE